MKNNSPIAIYHDCKMIRLVVAQFLTEKTAFTFEAIAELSTKNMDQFKIILISEPNRFLSQFNIFQFHDLIKSFTGEFLFLSNYGIGILRGNNFDFESSNSLYLQDQLECLDIFTNHE